MTYLEEEVRRVVHDPAHVPRDMARIFGLPEGASADKAKRADPVIAFMPDESWGRRRWARAIPLAALCFLTVGGAAWVTWQGAPPAATRLLREAAGPAQQPAPSRAPLRPALARAPAPVAKEPVLASVTVQPAVLGMAEKPTKSIPRPKSESGPPRTAEQGHTPGETRCDEAKEALPASCHTAELALADQQLRLAFARAAGEGMNPKLLAMFQKRWRQVRQEMESDPAYVTAAFRQLTRELDAARGSA